MSINDKLSTSIKGFKQKIIDFVENFIPYAKRHSNQFGQSKELQKIIIGYHFGSLERPIDSEFHRYTII